MASPPGIGSATRAERAFAAAVALGSLLSALLVLFAPPLPYWGDRHTPHTHKPPLQLSSGSTVEQTFRWERRDLDRVALWFTPATLPKTGSLALDVIGPKDIRSAVVDFRDIPSSGISVSSFATPLRAPEGSEGRLRLRLRENRSIYLQYQITSSIYPDGRLFLDGKEIRGDLAFQMRYERPALGSRTAHVLFALAILAAGVITARLALRPATNSGDVPPLKRRDLLIAAVLGLSVSAFYGWFLLRPGFWVGAGDFSKDAAYLATGGEALRQGAWPAWSHLTCGGMAALGNPEGSTISLGTLFATVLPPDRALLLLLTIEGGLAAAGTLLLARTLGLGIGGSLTAALVTSLSSSFAYRTVEGLTPVGGAVAFLPWVFLGLVRARNSSPWWMIFSGTALAGMFLRGDVHVVVGVIIVLTAWSLVDATRHRSLKPLILLAGIGAVSYLWSSVKILPYLEEPSLIQRALPPYVAPLLRFGLFDDALLRLHDRDVTVPVLHGERPERWGNFGAYVGLIPLGLATLGLLTRSPLRTFLGVSLGISLLLSEGTFFEDLLRHSTVLGSLLRIPTRLFSVAVLFLGLAAGLGVVRLTSRLPRRPRSLANAAIVGLLLFDLSRATGGILNRNLAWDSAPPPSEPDVPTLAPHANVSPRHQRHPTKLLRAGFLLPQICGDQNNPPIFVKNLHTDIPLTAAPAALAPNRIILSAPPGPADVTIRERFVSAWSPSAGTVLEDRTGAVHLVLPRGHPEVVELRHVDPLARAEQVIFVLFLLTLGVLAARGARGIFSLFRL